MGNNQPCFKRILVPLDGSRRAAQALRSISSFIEPDSRLVLLRVMTDANCNTEIVPPPNESSRRRHESVLSDLGRDANTFRSSRDAPVVQVEVIDGDPAEQILHAVGKHDIDLVVMTGEGCGKSHHLGLGSVARAVASRSPVPVFIIRNGAVATDTVPSQIRRIVAPLDCSDRSARAVKIASDLAKQLMIPIVAVTALDLASCGSPALAREAAYDQDLYRELFADVEMDARRTLMRTGAELSQQGLDVSVQLRVGPVAETLIGALSPGDLVVMTSRGRGGGRQWPMESVTEKLIETCPVPVLLVPTTPEPELIVRAFGDAVLPEPVNT
jgi:nucleotide-binding universal stress UspA family protein